MNKVIRNGKVGVLVSYGYGAGFHTWGAPAEAIFSPTLINLIENDKYETYYTEKLTDAFATGTIPVYWGTPDIGNYFNHEGIIELTPDFDIDSLTEELYNSKLDAVSDNFERVQNLLSADDMLYKQINEN